MNTPLTQLLDAQRKQRIRRNALLLALIALTFYGSFIVMSMR